MYINYFNGFVVGTWFYITGINLYVTNMTHDINGGKRKQHDTEIPTGKWGSKLAWNWVWLPHSTAERKKEPVWLGSMESPVEKCAVAPVHKPSSQEDKPGEPRVQGQPGTLARLRPIWAVRQDPISKTNEGGRWKKSYIKIASHCVNYHTQILSCINTLLKV